MHLISQISDLKTVSGGYDIVYDEFVTSNTILIHSIVEALRAGFTGGALGGFGGIFVGGIPGAAVLGTFGAVVGGYLGYKYNDYADIEPDTWVTWKVTYV
ncbi:MAG: hypothetical protein JSS07_01225 [Proteobacteria bacterium]|nr:hypothetical protein [Pseudomonadota bacterium]